MTQAKERDSRTQKEINVQYFQTVFHFMMASMIACTVPTEYLQEPNQSQNNILTFAHNNDGQWVESWGVRIAYLLSTTYHCVLYFWDPVTNTNLKAHHMASVFIGTVLLIYNNIGWAFLLMLTVYSIDLWNFALVYRQKYENDRHRERLLVMSMTKIHHMVTLMLLGVSWIQNLTAIGIWILFVHDLTDVPMFIIRILRKKNAIIYRQGFVAISVMIMWFYYRVWCMFSIIVEACENAWQQNPSTLPENVNLYYSCIAGLVILFSFNFYWTFLVWSKVINELFGVKTTQEDE
jgi:hypothetical protein